MAAARRSAGSGTLLALIIFVVLAFVGIFASIWFFQQYSTVSQAARQNQAEFAETVGKAFDEHGWKLSANEAPEYDLKYERKAYEEVAEQLSKAATYDELVTRLGWESLAGVNDRLAGLEQSLKNSPVQVGTEEPYLTVKGLLERYESEYLRLTQSDVPELQRNLKAQQDLLAEKTVGFERERTELLGKLNTEVASHAADMANSTKQFTQMEQLYKNSLAETRKQQGDFDAARLTWDTEKRLLDLEIAMWKDRYLSAMGGGEVSALKAGGEVLRVDPAYEFVMLGGGKDAQVQKNTRAVIYSEAPGGARVKKGEVLVTQVFPNTSLATIVGLEKDQRMLAGDVFVAEGLWDAYYHPEKAEVPQVTPAQPVQAQPKAGEVAPEAVAPPAVEEKVAPEAVTPPAVEENVAPEAVTPPAVEENVAPEEKPLDFF